MLDVLKELLHQLNSSVIILLCILFLSYWAVHVVTKLVEKFSHHEGKLGKVDALSDRIIELKTKVDLIYQNTNPHKLVAAHSPIAITESGQETARNINAEIIFKKYADRLAALVDEKKNAYDIQVESMRVTKEKMLEFLDANEINSIKAEAFSKGFLVEDIMGIFGVYLRDYILAKLGVAVSDVDKHQPAVS